MLHEVAHGLCMFMVEQGRHPVVYHREVNHLVNGCSIFVFSLPYLYFDHAVGIMRSTAGGVREHVFECEKYLATVYVDGSPDHIHQNVKSGIWALALAIICEVVLIASNSCSFVHPFGYSLFF